MIKITHIQVLDDFRLRLTYNDAQEAVWDAKPLLKRDGAMVKPLRDPEFFARVFLEAGAPTWPNGFDLAPWALHKETIASQINA